MADHEKEIEEFGNNDDFWLFGYGCEHQSMMHADKLTALQKPNLETTTTFWYTITKLQGSRHELMNI
jgi:hypothetical protein